MDYFDTTVVPPHCVFSTAVSLTGCICATAIPPLITFTVVLFAMYNCYLTAQLFTRPERSKTINPHLPIYVRLWYHSQYYVLHNMARSYSTIITGCRLTSSGTQAHERPLRTWRCRLLPSVYERSTVISQGQLRRLLPSSSVARRVELQLHAYVLKVNLD